MSLKFVIVGGDNSERLAEFIGKNAGGSIEVPADYIFRSFAGDAKTMMNTYIKANALIYLMDESPDIKEDLKVLYDLFNNPAFFRVGEIWIFGSDNDINTEGLKYVESVLSDLKFENYQIRTYDEGTLGFQDIYSEITGLKDAETNEVTRTKVYRARRSEDSHRGYDPEVYKKNIELKEDNSFFAYEDVKSASIKAETGKVIDAGESQDKENIDLKITSIDTKHKAVRRNVVVVSGFSKSGVSSMASRIVFSLIANKNSLSLVDLSSNCGSARNIIKSRVPCTIIDNKDYVLNEDYSDSIVDVFKCPELKDNLDKITYLRYIKTSQNRHVDNLYVIDCNLNLLKDVVGLCNINIASVFLCTEQNKEDVYLLKPYVEFLDGIKVYTYLNNNFRFKQNSDSCTPNEAKEILGNVMIISPLNLNKSINLVPYLNLEV